MRTRAVSPAWTVSTQTSQAAAAYIGKARAVLNRSIQGPGLGRRDSSAGAKLIATNGAAKPTPSARNTTRAASGGCTRAQPMAGAMNGAVQGAATTTARAPVKKAPARPRFVASPE